MGRVEERGGREAGRQGKGGPPREMGSQCRSPAEKTPLLFLASFQPFTHLLKTSACFVTLAGTWKTEQKNSRQSHLGFLRKEDF